MKVYNGLDQSPDLQSRMGNFDLGWQNQVLEAQNCLQGISGSVQGCYPYLPQQLPSFTYCQCSHAAARSSEFQIWRYGKEVKMDYGEDLKILMADPIKGMHLREAVQKLKEALLELKE